MPWLWGRCRDFDYFLENIEESSLFFRGFDGEECRFEVFGNFLFDVETDEERVLQACFCKFNEGSGEGGGEE